MTTESTEKHAHFLLEIGTEEIPARFLNALTGLSRDLADRLAKKLTEARLTFGRPVFFETPRRLAVIVQHLSLLQPSETRQVKGPPQSVAFGADGKPTPAAIGFARKQGIDVSQLQRSAEGDYVVAVIEEKGRPTHEMLPSLLEEVLTSLPLPIAMKWGEGDATFIRPVHWMVALLGDEVVPFSFAGIEASRTTRGHRLGGGGPVTLVPQDKEGMTPAAYEAQLRDVHVLVDSVARREAIFAQLTEWVSKEEATTHWDEALRDEVVALVEHPLCFIGKFHEKYLTLPFEVLKTTLKKNVKAFLRLNVDGSPQAGFWGVANHFDARVLPTVTAGYERVVTARFHDAHFFFQEDLKVPFSQWGEKLDKVTFLKGLGTLGDKRNRLLTLVARLGETLSIAASELAATNRIATLCKNDLATHMVYEFPDLQGFMGRVYAKTSGEDAVVAEGIFEHWLPRFSGDELPHSIPSALVSIADKLDNLLGCFAKGLIPTGSLDPYALRRQVTGLMQILALHRFPLKLPELLEWAFDQYLPLLPELDKAEVLTACHKFVEGRLRIFLQDDQGYRYDVVNALLGGSIQRVDQLIALGKALMAILDASWLPGVIQSHDRVTRLAKQGDGKVFLDPKKFVEAAETSIYERTVNTFDLVNTFIQDGEWGEALNVLSTLTEPIEQFFNDVLVMAEDAQVRANRLALLTFIRNCYLQLAAFPQIVLS